MPEIETRQFGPITYRAEQAIHFPAGLPGFEDCRDFILHEEPSMRPFRFLQSLTDTNLSFVTLPVELLEASYELTLSHHDLTQLGLHLLPDPDQILCLAILQLNTEGATANLAAPLVITPADERQPRRGTQSIRQDRRYSTSHQVERKGGAACS